MSGYRMIRAGSGYRVVLVVTPANSSDPHKATYYEYNPSRKEPGWKADAFNEVSWAQDAMYLFSGQADGLGFAPLPSDPFPSLEAVLEFMKAKTAETS